MYIFYVTVQYLHIIIKLYTFRDSQYTFSRFCLLVLQIVAKKEKEKQKWSHVPFCFQLSSCLPLDILKFNEKTGIVIIRVPKDNYAKVRAALTVCPSMRIGSVDVPVIYTTRQASSCLLSLAGPERSIIWACVVLRVKDCDVMDCMLIFCWMLQKSLMM